MVTPHPSLGRLSEIGHKLESQTAICIANFEEQLSLCPHSAQSMRRFAQFLTEVCLHP